MWHATKRWNIVCFTVRVRGKVRQKPTYAYYSAMRPWEATMDEAKLHQLMGQMLSDLGGAASVALVRIGDALGLYKTLHERGPMTVAEFATAAGLNQRYLREWLSHQ